MSCHGELLRRVKGIDLIQPTRTLPCYLAKMCVFWGMVGVALSQGQGKESTAPFGPECSLFDWREYHSHSELGYSESNLTKPSMSLWRFTSQKLIEAFPLDPIRENYIRQVKGCIFSAVTPTPFKSPVKLVAVSKEALGDLLDLDVSVAETDEFIQFVSGGRIRPGSVPLAHRYGGHQFGVWAGQLGDGRAHLLGEYINRHGARWELQLKGSGKTPYSRHGDGRAVLRSSVREFLCSEAMHYLGIPTTRVVSALRRPPDVNGAIQILIVSGDNVMRDEFYNGNVKNEKGAVVLRAAKSWFRIGSLEILARSGETELLWKLVDFIIKEHFPFINMTDPDRYLDFFSRIVTDTSYLIAHWMSVGFAHGVCNTDNFSLLSLTIDYGPFGFMDSYDPDFVPNASDDEALYKIGNQANIGRYNLDKLRLALNLLLDPKQQLVAQEILKGYPDLYQIKFQELFRAKLGLLGHESDDDYLIAYLLKLMEDTRVDFTMLFCHLSEITHKQLAINNIPEELWVLQDLARHEHFSQWVNLYLSRLKRNSDKDSDKARRFRMKSTNPRYVLRNWMAESAIRKSEKNDFSEVHLLQRILRHPFHEQREAEEAGYCSRPPSWARQLRVSCSS